MQVSVILPTHAPHSGRLHRTLAGLRAQTLPPNRWETLLVDNASPVPLAAAALTPVAPPNLRVIAEPALGLTPARLRGIKEAQGELLVFVDDDNVLDPHFLENALARFASSAQLGAAGGPVLPEWESPPSEWTRPFHGLLALRDHGPELLVAAGGAAAPWPHFAPVGAGLIVRRKAALIYAREVAASPGRHALDRRAGGLTSGGDCDLVFTILHHGSDVAYDPQLRLTHLIPASRLPVAYLARLNRGIMRSWVAVLALHGQCPWPPISRATVPLRAARAWWRRRVWSGSAARVRWAGDLGQFEGQADLTTSGRPSE